MVAPSRDSLPSPELNRDDPEKTYANRAVDEDDGDIVVVSEDVSLRQGQGEDILALQDLDPALNAKMHLVNNVSEKHGDKMSDGW